MRQRFAAVLIVVVAGSAGCLRKPAAAPPPGELSVGRAAEADGPAGEPERRRLARHRGAERLAMLVLAMRTAAAHHDAPEAEPPPDGEVALARMKQLFERGQDAYGEGDYAEALESFLAAYEVRPAASLLYNAAVCLEKMDDYGGASDLFEQYLDESPRPGDRERVERRIRALRGEADDHS